MFKAKQYVQGQFQTLYKFVQFPNEPMVGINLDLTLTQQQNVHVSY